VTGAADWQAKWRFSLPRIVSRNMMFCVNMESYENDRVQWLQYTKNEGLKQEIMGILPGKDIGMLNMSWFARQHKMETHVLLGQCSTQNLGIHLLCVDLFWIFPGV